MPDRVPVVQVWLNRAEGPTREVGERTVSSLADADVVIHNWAASAPKPGQGYDKVDFEVRWDDGETYKGRFDMTQNHRGSPNLIGNAVQHHLLFLSGLHRPDHWERDQYDRYLEEIGFGKGGKKRAEILRKLDTYEM